MDLKNNMNKKLLWIIIAVVVLIIGIAIMKSAGIFGKDEGVKATVEKAEKEPL